MVKDHSQREDHSLQPHSLLFPISSNFFYMDHPINRVAHTMDNDTPLVEHWLEQEIAQWIHYDGSIQQSIAPCAHDLPELYFAPNQNGIRNEGNILFNKALNTFRYGYIALDI